MVSSITKEGSGTLETWRLQNADALVEVVPGRGALVSRFCVGGDEVLFLDEATLRDESKNVRGGVPVLFPFAGKPPVGSTLPQHGFARRMRWSVAGDAEVVCTLRDDEATREAFPFTFEVRQRVALDGGVLKLTWEFENRGASEPMPLHFGIHPYFRVNAAAKADVRVSGATGEAFDNKAVVTRLVEQVDFSEGEVDLHFASTSGGTVLERGDGSKVTLEWSEQFDTLVVWTLPGASFVCVEPWTARGAQPSKRFVAPGRTETLTVTMRAR